MGNCGNKIHCGHRSIHLEEDIKLPDVTYLDRSSHRVLHITPKQRITRHNIKDPSKVFTDSAVGLLPNNRFLVVGGSESSGKLTCTTLFIDPYSHQMKQLANAPFPLKLGSLYEYKGWVYCLGAFSEKEEPIALLRFNLEDNYWEVLEWIQWTSKECMLEMNRVSPEESKREHFVLDNLFYPGTFAHSGKLYFLGGQVRKKGVMKPTKKVFSLDLKGEQMLFKEEEFKMPIRVIKPLCAAGTQHIVIAGGGDPERDSFNTSTFVLKLGDQVEFMPLDALNCSLTSNYPPMHFGKENLVMFFNYPKVVIRSKDIDHWIIFDLTYVSMNYGRRIKTKKLKQQPKGPSRKSSESEERKLDQMQAPQEPQEVQEEQVPKVDFEQHESPKSQEDVYRDAMQHSFEREKSWSSRTEPSEESPQQRVQDLTDDLNFVEQQSPNEFHLSKKNTVEPEFKEEVAEESDSDQSSQSEDYYLEPINATPEQVRFEGKKPKEGEVLAESLSMKQPHHESSPQKHPKRASSKENFSE